MFEEFQDGCSLFNYDASHQVLAQSTVWEEMSFEEFQDGHRSLGYRNGTILAILNLYVAPMPPIKFWRISWISERNNFSNSESLCHCDASHQVSAQSDLGSERRCCLKNFKMATMAAILDIGTELFKQFCISVSVWCLPSSFGSIRLTDWEMSFEEFQDGHHGGHLGYPNGMILAILNLCVTVMPSIKFQLNRT